MAALAEDAVLTGETIQVAELTGTVVNALSKQKSPSWNPARFAVTRIIPLELYG